MVAPGSGNRIGDSVYKREKEREREREIERERGLGPGLGKKIGAVQITPNRQNIIKNSIFSDTLVFTRKTIKNQNDRSLRFFLTFETIFSYQSLTLHPLLNQHSYPS